MKIIINKVTRASIHDIWRGRTYRNATNHKTAFTLVEIMIVVAIIGLLAAIAIPNFVKARNTAQTNACINNLRQIESATQQWAIENKKTGTDLVTQADIQPYIGRTATGDWPKCPAGGVYNVSTVDSRPTCNIENHELP